MTGDIKRTHRCQVCNSHEFTETLVRYSTRRVVLVELTHGAFERLATLDDEEEYDVRSEYACARCDTELTA